MEANFTIPPPPPPPENNTNNDTVVDNTVTLQVTLKDSGRDGYNGNVFGIYQNGSLIARFGAGYTTGVTFGPVNLTVYKDIPATIQMV